jgi:hypothetical protein
MLILIGGRLCSRGRALDHILILNFAKGFDKVNHSLLIHKLQHYGIIGKSVRWIQNWLANRKQSVVIDGSTSDAVSVDSGVPQGSVLGPGLFLYYINDLQSRLTSTVRLFADDTIAYLTISNNNDAETLQKDLDKLGHWENEWSMKFHPDKCTVLTASEVDPSITTDCFLFASQFCIHLTDFPIIP